MGSTSLFNNKAGPACIVQRLQMYGEAPRQKALQALVRPFLQHLLVPNGLLVYSCAAGPAAHRREVPRAEARRARKEEEQVNRLPQPCEQQ